MSWCVFRFLCACLILGTNLSVGVSADNRSYVDEANAAAEDEVNAGAQAEDGIHGDSPRRGNGCTNTRRGNHRMQKLVFVSDTRVVFVQRKMVDILEDCLAHKRSLGIRTEDRGFTSINVTEADMDELYRHCHMLKPKKEGLHREKRFGITYPGTKWCGFGNVASSYDDLGEQEVIDSCCRSHDNCSPRIGAMQSKYGLFNFALWSKSHCDCDESFYSCLKAANDVTIGHAFFNQISVGCIAEGYPVVCVKTGWWGICTKRGEDTSQPKVMRFKDNTLVY